MSYGIHAAKLADTDSMRRGPQCAFCWQPIKRVPGGQGPCWVHSDTGAVAASNLPPSIIAPMTVETVQAQVIGEVAAQLVDGVQFTGTDGTVWIFAPESFYLVRVDSEGSTYSAYLIAGQPDAADTPGWATGWEAPTS